jgi:hypothetical protein
LFWFYGRPFGKSSRWFFQRRGERVSLSANGVGGEGRGEVARELKHPAPGDENRRCQNHFGAKSIHCQSFLIGV